MHLGSIEYAGHKFAMLRLDHRQLLLHYLIIE